MRSYLSLQLEEEMLALIKPLWSCKCLKANGGKINVTSGIGFSHKTQYAHTLKRDSFQTPAISHMHPQIAWDMSLSIYNLARSY